MRVSAYNKDKFILISFRFFLSLHALEQVDSDAEFVPIGGKRGGMKIYHDRLHVGG